jgi:hypothetical protein
MRQQDIIMRQLAERVIDFVEPAIPYLIVGTKRAAEKAGKKLGPEIWEGMKELWEKLCSEDCPELEIAARDLIIAPSDPEVKQVLIQVIIKSFESNLNLVKDVLYFMGKEEVQRILANDSSINTGNTLSERDRVLQEFNRLLEEFVEKGSTFQDLEQLGIPSVKMATLDNEITAEGNLIVRKPWRKYTHIVLDQRLVTENTPLAARMAQIAEIKVKNQSREAQRTQALFLLASQLQGPIKEEFVEKALDFACNIKYGDLRAEILSNIVPVLEGPRKAELIKKAFYSASAIEDADERSLVFSSLARHLREPGKEELIVRIFEFSFFIEYDDAKFQILSSLVPHLYGSEKYRSEKETQGIINTALELVSGFISNYRKIESYSMLIPFLNEQRKDEILGKALNLAFNLNDKDMRPEALSLIIPYLNEPRRSEIIGESFKLASEIKSDSRRRQTFSSLAPYFEDLNE